MDIDGMTTTSVIGFFILSSGGISIPCVYVKKLKVSLFLHKAY